MAGTERALTTRDTVLLIADAVGGTVNGRTVMQKLAYFSSIGLGTTLGHRPYYYGPYSSKVEDALEVASIAGELRETAQRLPDWDGEPDAVQYTYELTEAGRARVSQLKAQAPLHWERIETAVQAIRGAIPDLNQKMLSSAAKTYLIISDSDEDVNEEEIPSLASRLGWELSSSQVDTTISILQRLGLIEDATTAG